MTRLVRPLDAGAVAGADDAFYARHPELVQKGSRVPLSPTDPRQAALRKEWVDLYKQQGGKVENGAAAPSRSRPDELAQACPDDNWIELKYLYCDGSPVGGARYLVHDRGSGAIVAQGTLDSSGFAHCALPLGLEDVTYDFDADPAVDEYLRQPAPNPNASQVPPGWRALQLRAKFAAAGEWTWGAVQGDFNEDPTLGQVVVGSVITMVPIVDQVGDVRDIVANLKLLIYDKRYDDKWVWIALVITLIGLIPVLGSAAKGVLKVVFKGIKTGARVPLKSLIEVLNWAHKGNAVVWLRKLAAELPKHAGTAKKTLKSILEKLRSELNDLRTLLPDRWARKVDDTIASVDEVAKKADSSIDEATKELQDGLNKSIDEGADFDSRGATKDLNTRQQVATDPPDAPVREPTKVKRSNGGRSGDRTKVTGNEAERRGLTRENESADALANNGYTVKQNPPPKPNGKDPDYLIEGEHFDCYAPSQNKSLKGIWDVVDGKVGSGQADRIVLNLDDWSGNIEDISAYLKQYPVKDLQEVLVVRGGQVFSL